MKFIKYSGLGNDFIITETDINSELVKKLCDRHFGIGADGLIVYQTKNNIPFMKFFNQDGSMAKMCGNGIRCYTHYLSEKLKIYDEIIIDTLAGIKKAKIKDFFQNKMISEINMGSCKELGVIKLNIDNIEFKLYKIDSGTDHVVYFGNNISIDFVKKYGSIIEKRFDIFKNGTNVNFVDLSESKNNFIKIFTFERGVGLTLACGTGCVASCYAYNKYFNGDKIIDAKIPGGILNINLNDYNNIYMTGESIKIFEGEIDEKI